ncbi:conserved hypothetical protein [Neospora caninum Liverpool]|uniref:Mitotic checkpoint prcc-carboxy-term protein n=1 Tax=Neospora caninum (strain Liverpool) TaxID=572307 RepID=F0VLM8_NEOCL|nr:conserved hypothetical protein [Neospora caninum Liverpool]CBZ54156.1 conserved hypothetical protein [Neospora caninum Liverpool]CEL68856.1 TPA: hypothetical protein BN1204_045880 [Neospora caninum Liverpool]|eukprot:XP_003884187.1 conserved hypothetical protein [Neospora caninum Liverpool]
MLGAILSSYAEDDESPSAPTSATAGGKDGSGPGSWTGSASSIQPEFSTSRTKPPVNLTRLQMCCPTIVGAGDRSGSSVTAHDLFAKPTSFANSLRTSSSLPFPVPKSEGKFESAVGGSTPASSRVPSEGDGKGKSDSRLPVPQAAPSPDVVLGPDNVPLLQYGRGVFTNAEEEDLEEFRQLKLQQHRRKKARENLHANSSPEADGLPPPSSRGQALLRMLPKPQSGTAGGGAQGDGWNLSALRLGRAKGFGNNGEGPRTRAPGNALKRVKEIEDGARDRASAADAASGEPDGAVEAENPPKQRRLLLEVSDGAEERGGDEGGGDDEGDEAESGSGPLFSLFSAYNEDDNDESPTAAPVKTEPITPLPARAGVAEPSGALGSGSLKTNSEVNTIAEIAQAAAPLYGPEAPSEDVVAADVWGSAADAGLGTDGEFGQPQMMEGMSVREYRELQQARVGVLSGDALRDPNWQMNAQLYGATAQKKREKLTITTNVWSAKDKGVIQTQEPRGMQKRKHQINWLAAEAAEKELEMWEMLSKNRQNKYQTAMKYGW